MPIDIEASANPASQKCLASLASNNIANTAAWWTLAEWKITTHDNQGQLHRMKGQDPEPAEEVEAAVL